MKYDLVVGLETHVELSTKTKIFCSCINGFGAKPNTHCCPICVGHPGTLPKMNREVVNLAIKAGLATNCKINLLSKMDRKNYVYPDLAKAYQISQYEIPICQNGFIELSSGKKIRINRIHMEEDAGKLVHSAGDVFIDYNRAGVPLIEIVTEPDINSSEEAKEYVEKLQNILKYAGVSDCKMQEGSMRCDVNISIKPSGSTEYGTRTEIKNMNSITFISKAIDAEFERQMDILESGEEVVQQTRRYSESSGTTESMRDKEDAQDYRYFKDPDLTEIILTDEEIEKIKSSLPAMPETRKNRYISEWNISEKDASLITKYKNVADFFEEVSEKVENPKTVSNFIIGEIFRNIETESEKEKFNISITANQLVDLVKLIESNKINMNLGKKTLHKMLETGKDVTCFISENDLKGISEEELHTMCQEAIKNNSAAVSDYLGGKEKALKAILGNVMKQTRGRGNAQEIEALLIKLIKSSSNT